MVGAQLVVPMVAASVIVGARVSHGCLDVKRHPFTVVRTTMNATISLTHDVSCWTS